MLRLLDRLAHPNGWERDWLRGPFFNWDISELLPTSTGIENFPVNVYTNKDSVRVHMSLPGWNAEWLDISVEENKLAIKGKNDNEQNNQTFTRVINLPFRADADLVKANYKNGILTIDLHKSEQDKARKISITA